MKPINWKYIWMVLNKYVLNKYVFTLIVFAIIFLFVGEQSLLKDMKRSAKIHETEQAIEEASLAIETAERKLNSLQQLDSLEKFAREHYLMHKENEDIFLVEEE